MNPTPNPRWCRRVRALALIALGLIVATSLFAQTVAHENFDSYAAGSALDSLDGGTGWTSPWSGIAGVTISDEPVTRLLDTAMLGGGRSLRIAANANNAFSRTVTPATNGEDRFVSFVFRIEGGAPDASVTGNVFTGWQATDTTPDINNDNIGYLGLSGQAGARVKGSSSSIPVQLRYGQTYFYVIQYTGWNGSNYTTTRVWLNPTTTDYTSTDAAITRSVTVTDPGAGSAGFFGLRVRSLGLSDSVYYLVDELRVGSTWSAVVSPPPGYTGPEPHPDPQPELIVFGDSLSSGGRSGVPSTGPTPTPSNGNYPRQTWIQQLSPMIGFGTLVNYYEPGGTNYAVGGDTTVGMVHQVDHYLTDVAAVSNPAATYVLWCGGNDIGHTVAALAEGATIFTIFSRLSALNAEATAAAEAAVDRMEAQIRRLATTGATTFVWVNLPDLSKTPAVDYYVTTYAFGLSSVRSTVATALRNASDAFNARLVARVAALHAELSAITIHQLDAHWFFEDVIAHKESYGFTNVTESNTMSNDYLFYDNVHPTSHGHYELAQYAYAFWDTHDLIPAGGGSGPNPDPAPLGNAAGIAAVRAVPDLVAFWDFAEPAGTARASWPNGYELTDGNASVPVARVAGGLFSGYAARFDATNQWLTLPNAELGGLNIAGPSAQVTVVAWVRRTTENNSFIAGIWQEDNNDPRRQYGLFVDLPMYGGPDNVCGHVSLTGGPSPGLPFSRDYSANLTPVRNDRWHMVAFTYDGTYARSWLDGRFESRPSYTEPGAPNGQGLTYPKNPYYFPDGLGDNGGDFTVGAVRLTAGMRNQFQGQISGVAVYNRALTAEELSRLHLASLAPAPDGTVAAAVYPFTNLTGAKATVAASAWRAFKNQSTEWSNTTADGWIVPQNIGHGGEAGFLAKNSFGETGIAWTEAVPAVPSSAVDRIEFTLNNAFADDAVHIAVKFDGRWFVTRDSWHMSASGGTVSNWATFAEKKTFVWTTAASAWQGLAFDESTKVWTHTGDVSTDLPEAALEAIGFWQPANLGTLRIDDLALYVRRGDALGAEPAITGYAAWKAERFTAEELANPDVSGAAADPDGDGRVNLLEYAAGSDPRSADSSPLVNVFSVQTEAGVRPAFDFERSKSAAVLLTPQVSTDLDEWHEGPEHIVLVSTEDLGATERLTWHAISPLASQPRLFVRLRVVPLP